jgi:carboxyl-terminal processing protease
VVIDLRFNSGGFPMLLLNLLLPPGRPVYRTMDASGLRVSRTDAKAAPYAGPLAILTGPASASAAEVSTAVLKRLGRAIVIGRRTNGSVLGAPTFPLPDGGRVQVPVQELIMLDGTRLEGAGVAPNLVVLASSADLRAGRDTALLEALRTLNRSRPPT